MRRRTISRAHLAALVLAALLAGGALAQMSGPAPVALTADEMNWSPQGALALPGLEQVNLVGEPSKPRPLHDPPQVSSWLQAGAAHTSRSSRSHDPIWHLVHGLRRQV